MRNQAVVVDLARSLERSARSYAIGAAHWSEEADRYRRQAEACERDAARDMGTAAGYAFRAAELRYDARDGLL